MMKTIDSLIAEREDADNRADYVEARLAEMESAVRDLIEGMWSCNACGPHPSSTGRWCASGCGSDFNRMTPPKKPETSGLFWPPLMRRLRDLSPDAAPGAPEDVPVVA